LLDHIARSRHVLFVGRWWTGRTPWLRVPRRPPSRNNAHERFALRWLLRCIAFHFYPNGAKEPRGNFGWIRTRTRSTSESVPSSQDVWFVRVPRCAVTLEIVHQILGRQSSRTRTEPLLRDRYLSDGAVLSEGNFYDSMAVCLSMISHLLA
jgi:hypothetical protein